MTKDEVYESEADDLVLVHVKAPSGYHKTIDQWEDKQYQFLSQLDNQPVFECNL